MTLSSSQIVLVMVAIVNLFLSFIVLLTNKKKKVNRVFSFFLVLVSLWALSLVFLQVKKTMIWSHCSMITGIWMGTFFLLFSETFPDEKKKISIKKYLLILIPAFVFTLFVLFKLIIKDIKIVGNNIEPVLGIFYPLFLAYVVIYAAQAITILGFKYRKANGLPKTQLKYVFFGFTLFIISIVLSNIILPVFGINQTTFLGPAFSLFLVGSVTYAITRYRLMDIRLVIGKGMVYLFSFSVIVAIGFSIYYLNVKAGSPISNFFLIPLNLIIGVLLFPIIFSFYEHFAAKFFYYTFYSYQKVLTDLSKKLTGILDLEKLSDLIANTLTDTMKLSKVAIILKASKTDNHEIQKIVGFKKENGLNLINDSFLISFLEKTKKPLVYEELLLITKDLSRNKEELVQMQTTMERIEAEAFLPLLIEDKIIGLIVLGKKLSGEPYSAQDIELLTNLANQSAIAFQNSRFYQEVEDLSKNLEKRVKEQVKQIEKLSEMKTEFLKVVNHQLRTPVSIIKGMSSMLAEEKLPAKKKEDFIAKLYQSADRLNTILDDILTAQNVIGNPISIDLRPCKMEDIIKSEIDHKKTTFPDKDVKITFKRLSKIIPIALFDEENIKRVVTRLIDNALLYTEKGKVEVFLDLKEKKGKKFIKITVKDTGIGLNDEDKKNIFKLFQRGEKATSLHPNGSGLGLFIVKSIVEAHKGTIKAESQGRGKGTTFTVDLPFLVEV